MIEILFHSECLLHDTGPHPERPERLLACREAIAASDVGVKWDEPDVLAGHDELAWVHSSEHIRTVEDAVRRAPSFLDPDTPVSPQSMQAALRAAGLAVEGARRVCAGDAERVFCLIRPPGHHATRSQAMGFCLFNNIAIAAAWCRRQGAVDRLLIVDFDVHHGNGTQDIFYRDPTVMFFSIHRYPFYPGTGSAAEVGAGPGEGFTVNVPVRYGTPRAEYLQLFRRCLDHAAEKITPQLVLVSAGFDGHRNDPIGGLGLESDDYRLIGEVVASVAARYCDGKTVSVLEGGYSLRDLGESVVAYLRGLGGA